MHISQKGETISGTFGTFFKSVWNFAYLEKKDQLHILNISEVIDSKKRSYLNAKKQLFQNNLQQWTHSRVPNTP